MIYEALEPRVARVTCIKSSSLPEAHHFLSVHINEITCIEYDLMLGLRSDKLGNLKVSPVLHKLSDL